MRKIIASLSCLMFAFFVLVGCECAHQVVTEGTCTSGSVCENCGKVVSEAAGHQFEKETCRMGKLCKVCGIVEGLPGDHSYSEATCTKPSTCVSCSKKVGKALGHKVDSWTILSESTCSEMGERTGFCSRCNSDVTEEIATLPHTAGEWEVKEAATWQQNGIMVRYCLVCGAEAEESSYSLTDDEIKDSCKSYEYEEIARYPDKYKGELAKFKGEVVQVVSDGNKYVLRVNVTYNSRLDWYEDTIYVTYTAPSGSWRILEDDIITLYGVLTGDKTYETIFGSTVTIPSLKALYIELG